MAETFAPNFLVKSIPCFTPKVLSLVLGSDNKGRHPHDVFFERGSVEDALDGSWRLLFEVHQHQVGVPNRDWKMTNRSFGVPLTGFVEEQINDVLNSIGRVLKQASPLNPSHVRHQPHPLFEDVLRLPFGLALVFFFPLDGV